MFIAALFTIAKTWTQPKCQSTEEWMKSIWYLYAMEYYLAIKRKIDIDEPICREGMEMQV